MTSISRSHSLIIDDIVVSAMEAGKEPGVSISITGPKGDYAKAFGISKRGLFRHQPMTLDKRVRIGSITKSFTATAILQQLDKGTLTLDATLDQFVPGVPNGDKITIKHLMTMRSGVYDYTTYIGIQALVIACPTWPFVHNQTLIDLIKKHPSQFAPGTQYAYNNSNYILLGAVLEKVVGKPIWQILDEDIIKPVGLTNTQWPTTTGISAPASHGYSNRLLFPKRLKDQTKVNTELYGAAGVLTSTVGDMLKWGEYLKTESLLAPNTHELRTETFYGTPYPGEGPDHYGYGLGLVSFGSWIGHDGSVPGFSAVSMYDTKSGAVFAGVENLQTTGLAVFSRIFERIADLLYPGSMTSPGYLVM